MADSHTSDFECAETYFGASPFSEPEETAVANLIAELGRVEWYIGAYPLFTCSSEELTWFKTTTCMEDYLCFPGATHATVRDLSLFRLASFRH